MQDTATTFHSGWHFTFFVVSVLIPFNFVLLMNGIEGLFERLTLATWPERLMKIAWESCVLTIGLIGGVLSNSAVIGSLGEDYAAVIAIGSVVIALATAIQIAYWRKERDPKGWKVFASLALSGGALAIPAYVALVYGR